MLHTQPKGVLNDENAGIQYNQETSIRAETNDEQRAFLDSLLLPWNENVLNHPILAHFNGSSKISDTYTLQG